MCFLKCGMRITYYLWKILGGHSLAFQWISVASFHKDVYYIYEWQLRTIKFSAILHFWLFLSFSYIKTLLANLFGFQIQGFASKLIVLYSSKFLTSSSATPAVHHSISFNFRGFHSLGLQLSFPLQSGSGLAGTLLQMPLFTWAMDNHQDFPCISFL